MALIFFFSNNYIFCEEIHKVITSSDQRNVWLIRALTLKRNLGLLFVFH